VNILIDLSNFHGKEEKRAISIFRQALRKIFGSIKGKLNLLNKEELVSVTIISLKHTETMKGFKIA